MQIGERGRSEETERERPPCPAAPRPLLGMLKDQSSCRAARGMGQPQGAGQLQLEADPNTMQQPAGIGRIRRMLEKVSESRRGIPRQE